MFRDFLIFLRKPTFIVGRGDRGNTRKHPVRNGQFASFMSVQGNTRGRNSDRHDRRLQFGKLMRVSTMLAAAIGIAWIAVESAKALSVF